MILAKIYFSELARKIQERQVFCEGAYPLWSVTELNTTYFVVIFPYAVFKYEQDKEREAFPTGVYIDVHDQGKTQVATLYCDVFQNGSQKSTR